MPDALTAFLDLLQSAPAGSRTLDERIGCALAGRVEIPGLYPRRASDEEFAPAAQAPRWSEDLAALLRLIPPEHNFSLGERDGVLWAWVQPNDNWTPAANEARHDHPRGSGLIVACTLPLAVAAALVVLHSLP
jgi:hypothetical protein